MSAWVVIRNVPGGYELCCLRCGDKYEPAVPCAIDIFCAISEAYGKRHSRCIERLGSATP